jgi:hypothetical protein
MLINRTYCVFNGEAIFFYDKSTYCKESDTNVFFGYIYKFGNGYCTPMETPIHKTKSDAIFNSIGVEICMDYFCGIRKSTNWKVSANGTDQYKMLLIQSNYTPILTVSDNDGNMPKDMPILYSDAFYDFKSPMVASGNLVTSFSEGADKEVTYSLDGGTDTVRQKYHKIELDGSAIGGGYNQPAASTPAATAKETFKIFIHELECGE